MLIVLFLILMATQVYAAGAPVRTDDGDTLVDQADITVSATAILIKASNSNRASLNCTTTNGVRWGTSAVTATRGQLIPANASVSIHNTASIYMIAETDAATVSCTEETYSSTTGTIFSP